MNPALCVNHMNPKLAREFTPLKLSFDFSCERKASIGVGLATPSHYDVALWLKSRDRRFYSAEIKPPLPGLLTNTIFFIFVLTKQKKMKKINQSPEEGHWRKELEEKGWDEYHVERIIKNRIRRREGKELEQEELDALERPVAQARVMKELKERYESESNHTQARVTFRELLMVLNCREEL